MGPPFADDRTQMTLPTNFHRKGLGQNFRRNGLGRNQSCSCFVMFVRDKSHVNHDHGKDLLFQDAWTNTY